MASLSATLVRRSRPSVCCFPLCYVLPCWRQAAWLMHLCTTDRKSIRSHSSARCRASRGTEARADCGATQPFAEAQTDATAKCDTPARPFTSRAEAAHRLLATLNLVSTPARPIARVPRGISEKSDRSSAIWPIAGQGIVARASKSCQSRVECFAGTTADPANRRPFLNTDKIEIVSGARASEFRSGGHVGTEWGRGE